MTMPQLRSCTASMKENMPGTGLGQVVSPGAAKLRTLTNHQVEFLGTSMANHRYLQLLIPKE